MKRLFSLLFFTVLAFAPTAANACDVCELGTCRYFFFYGNPVCTEILVITGSQGYYGCEVQGYCNEYGPPIPGEEPTRPKRSPFFQVAGSETSLYRHFTDVIGTPCRLTSAVPRTTEAGRYLLSLPDRRLSEEVGSDG